MSITKVKTGRYRAQVYNPATGRNISVSKVIGGSSFFESKADAKNAREKARALLAKGVLTGPTLAAFAYRWKTDPLWQRPKGSTNHQNHWAIREFVDLYGHLPIKHISHEHVSEYLAGGKRSHRIQALRTLFSDAGSVDAGRLVDSNPFTGLRASRTKGHRHSQPPSEQKVWDLIAAARQHAGPNFSAWLQVACFTGLRPGELDALKWSAIDFAGSRILVREQYNARTRTFTAPKNGLVRDALLTPHAIEALQAVARTSEFCFQAPRGGHYTPAARRAPWARARTEAGWTGSIYLATRHFAGAYMVNVLGLDSEDVAVALGHTDGGQLVRTLYGHRSTKQALERVAAAFVSAETAHYIAHNPAETARLQAVPG